MTTSINDYSYRTWENTNTNNVSKSSEESSNVASTATTAAGVANSTVSGIADEAVKDKVTLSETSKNGYLGKLESLAKEYPKTAKGIKFLSKIGGHVFNAIGGYFTGKEVAEQHSNGDVKHDKKVNDAAVTGGVAGGVAGGAAGATAGAVAGAAFGSFIPIIGTGIGALVGGVIGGYFGSSYGAEYGAEAGANSAERKYNKEKYEQALKQAAEYGVYPPNTFSWGNIRWG